MNTKEIIAKRVRKLCTEKGIAINALAKASGITPSTVYSILNQKSKNPGILTIQKLCAGLGISLQSFFDSKMFK